MKKPQTQLIERSQQFTKFYAHRLPQKPFNPKEDIFQYLAYDKPLIFKVLDHTLSVQPVNASSSTKGIADKNNSGKVKYTDAFQNTDIVLTKSTNKLKEDILLKQTGHPKEFKYSIDWDETKVTKDEEGNINFFPFKIPAPFLIDAEGNKSSTDDVRTIIDGNTLTLIPSQQWLDSHPYPIILDPTIEITILNVHSHPQQGDNWEVSFSTLGTQDLYITPEDESTIIDDEFTGLFCGAEQRTPQILANDVIFFPNWQCNETGKVVHLTLKAGQHTLRFEFGDQVEYAYNSATEWLTGGYGYRKAINIDNTANASALSDYQVSVTLDTATLVLAGKMLASGNDIRFTKSNGSDNLDYWIESGINTTTTKIWVEVAGTDTIPANSNYTMYMYYGNAAAASVSNGDSVFDATTGYSLDITSGQTYGDSGVRGLTPSRNGAEAFDDSINETQGYNSDSGYNEWASVQFSSGKIIRKVNIYVDSYSFYGAKIEGSNNGTDWSKIPIFYWEDKTVIEPYNSDEMYSVATGYWASVFLDNPNSYTYYRVFMYSGRLSTSQYNFIALAEVEMMTSVVTSEPTTYAGSEQVDGQGYGYRKAFTIDNSAGSALTNYQVKVTDPIYNETGLVGSWHFEENGGTTTADSSGNGNTGTITNATWTTGNTSPNTGKALSFDGVNDNIKLGSSSVLKPTADITILSWIKGTGDNKYILRQSDTGVDDGYQLWINANGYARWTVLDASVDIGTVIVNDNAWHLIAATFKQNTEAKIYVDGVIDTIDNSVTSIDYTGTVDTYIGTTSSGSGFNFNGTIDEVKIYNRALSAAEIQAQYEAKAKLNYTDLRFTDSTDFDESTWDMSYPYWQETDGTYWVRVPEIAASANKTIYAYYGNATATAVGSGTNTFAFFDDFSGDLSKWTSTAGASVSGGILSITNGNNYAQSISLFGTNNIIEFKGYIPYIGRQWAGWGHNNTGPQLAQFDLYNGVSNAHTYIASNLMTAITNFTGAWNKFQITLSTDVKYYLNGALEHTEAQLPTSDRSVFFQVYTGTVTQQIDYALVRKYAVNEPN